MNKKISHCKREYDCLELVKKLISPSNPISSYLALAKPNHDVSKFPDFIFDEGFIEHFQVTSAKETKSGDEHRIAEVEFDRDSKAEFEREKQEFLSSKPHPRTLTTRVLEAVFFLAENFLKKF